MTKSLSPGAKALAYAEDTLGVHEVYKHAREAHERLDDALTILANSKDKRRALEVKLQDVEMEVAADERSKHADMSAAAMEKHLKIVLNADVQVRDLRRQILDLTNTIEGLEYDRSIEEAAIRIAVARLTELGGYLNYLAAVKQAQRPDAKETGEAK